MSSEQCPYMASCGQCVTACLLTHGIFLLSFFRRTHILFGMCSYDWVHCLVLLSSFNSSFIELQPYAVPLLLLPDGVVSLYSFMLTVSTLIYGQPRLLTDSIVLVTCSRLLTIVLSCSTMFHAYVSCSISSMLPVLYSLFLIYAI